MLPAIVCIGVYALLFALIPYSEGYLGGRRSIFSTAYNFWNGYEDWRHGMFVPFFAAFIVWLRRKKLAEIPIQGSNWGLPILIFSLALYWLGYAIDHHYVGFVSAQFFIAGLIVWFLGWPMMKALFFPWAFLIFMWPFLFLDSLVAFPLRMMLSDLAYHFLNDIGLASVKIGSAVVSAPDPTLHLAAAERWAIDIADPCSGIRSLFALTMVSALYAYFTVPGFWRKVIIVAAAIPFAILGNFARILLLVFGTIIFGSDFAIGSLEHPTTYHMAAGFFVFLVALGAMVLLAKLLTIDRNTVGSWLKKTASLRREFSASQPQTATASQDVY